MSHERFSKNRRRLLRLAAGGLAGQALAGWGLPGFQVPLARTAAQPGLPNVVLVVADALRADHVTSYGYMRPTTPRLDALLAAEGVRFAQATTTAPWTLPANAALLTGRLPARMGIDWRGSNIPLGTPTLAGLLGAAGYSSAAFVNAYYVSAQFGFERDFDHFDYARPGQGQPKVPANAVSARVLDWLRSWAPTRGAQPLFLFVYYFDSHAPFLPPAPYDRSFVDPTYAGQLRNNAYGTGLPVLQGTIIPNQDDVAYLKALYDGTISFFDDQLGRLLDGLQGLGLLDNTLLVVTSDHGEQFGEHGKWTHTNSLYEEVMRVPLLMRYPGVLPAGRVVTTPVLHLDVLPTILDLAGLAIPEGLSGVPLRNIITPSSPIPPRDIFSEVNGAIFDPAHPLYWYAARADLRAIQRDGYKLIHRLGRDDGDELYLLEGQSQYERENLVNSSEHRERARELREALLSAYYPQHANIPLALK